MRKKLTKTQKTPFGNSVYGGLGAPPDREISDDGGATQPGGGKRYGFCFYFLPDRCSPERNRNASTNQTRAKQGQIKIKIQPPANADPRRRSGGKICSLHNLVQSTGGGRIKEWEGSHADVWHSASMCAFLFCGWFFFIQLERKNEFSIDMAIDGMLTTPLSMVPVALEHRKTKRNNTQGRAKEEKVLEVF